MNAPPPSQTVFLVDDDPAVRRALGRLLRSAGLTVAEFPSARAFLDDHGPGAAGVLVLDVAMPDVRGPDLHQLLADAADPLPVVFLTGRGDIPTGIAAMKAGAVDFLTKPCDDAALLDAVARGLALDRQRRAARAQGRADADRLALLTPRERQVMLGVVAGLSNKAIAADLGAAEKTIKVHRGRVMAKLAVASVPNLVRLAERAGLTPGRPPGNSPDGSARSLPAYDLGPIPNA